MGNEVNDYDEASSALMAEESRHGSLDEFSPGARRLYDRNTRLWPRIRSALLPNLIISAFLLAILLLFSYLGLFNQISSRQASTSQADPSDVVHPHSHSHDLNCGNSSAEAIAKGCTFNLMTFAWLPEACWEHEMTNKWLERTQGEFQWYADPNGLDELPQEPHAIGLRDKVYASPNWHESHCAFSWRKFHKALVYGGLIDGLISKWVHTMHCTRVLLRNNTRLTHVDVEYGVCMDIQSVFKPDYVLEWDTADQLEGPAGLFAPP